jgi:hypothetical protein
MAVELIKNGDFSDGGTYWLMLGWTAQNSRAEYTAGGSDLSQSILTAGHTYKLVFDYSVSQGRVYYRLGTNNDGYLDIGSGTETYVGVANGPNLIFAQSNLAIGDWIDNVSVTEVSRGRRKSLSTMLRRR